MRRDIEKRAKVDGKLMRFLSCGHSVPEPKGSKACKATWAQCTACDVPGTERAKSGPRKAPVVVSPEATSKLQQLQQMYRTL